MTISTQADAFHDGLEHTTSTSDDDLLTFARQLRTVSASPLETDQRQAMWAAVIAGQPRSTSPLPPVGRRRVADSSRGSKLVNHRLPAPAVLFFGIVVAVIFAFSGLGNGGSDMVTPTAYAQQAATAISSPITIVPTSAIDQPQD